MDVVLRRVETGADPAYDLASITIGRPRQGRRPKHSPQTGRGRLSEAEPQSDRGSDVVALEKAEGQTAIHLREHDPGIEIPLWCKPPIDSGGDPVECPGALRVLGAEAGGGPPGGGAEERILDIMVIGADHIQVFSNSVLGPDPHDLESLVAKTVHAEGGIVDIRVVDRIA